MQGLKVVKLVAENVKGLKAIEITPDENFQVIAGKNGQGKTSVIDTIWLGLGGGAASKGLERPVRNGESNAFVELDMGEFVVKRKWTSNDKSTLQVVSKEGVKFSSPQKMLDELIGRLSFDPLAFSNLDTKEQLKTLFELVDIDPTPIETSKKKIFDERTIVNREVKSLKSQIEALPKYDENIPEQEITAGEIVSKMTAAQDKLRSNDEIRNRYNNLGGQYNNLKQEIETDDRQIEHLEAQLNRLRNLKEEKIHKLNQWAKQGSELQETIQALVDPDMSVFQKQLSEVEETNKKIREKKAAQELISKLQSKAQESDTLTLKINELDQQKSEMIKAAKFPIEGLTFDESGVLYNGVPFKQCSAAERLKVSMAMAMALNPKLRVIRILDGSLLDSTNMKVIQDMVKLHDYQVWIEIVDESGTVGITIEDGEIKNFGGNAE